MGLCSTPLPPIVGATDEDAEGAKSCRGLIHRAHLADVSIIWGFPIRGLGIARYDSVIRVCDLDFGTWDLYLVLALQVCRVIEDSQSELLTVPFRHRDGSIAHLQMAVDVCTHTQAIRREQSHHHVMRYRQHCLTP